MCGNGNENIVEYTLRRNREGYYFCGKCKHNHRVSSKIGVSHIEYDSVGKVVEKKDNTDTDIWLERYNAMKKLRFPNDIGAVEIADIKERVEAIESKDDPYYERFKAGQRKWKNRKF